MKTVPGSRRTRSRAGAAVAVGVLIAGLPASLAVADDDEDAPVSTVIDGLDSPRGLAVGRHGRFVVAEIDGTFSRVTESSGDSGADRAKIKKLGSVPATFIAPAVDIGRRHKVLVLTPAGAPGSGAGTLYKWRRGYPAPKPVADIMAYQATDPDPYDLEDNPAESNPFGLAALRDGSVLVADAAGNDLLRVYPDGDIVTVARLKPRLVTVPAGIPSTVKDPEGHEVDVKPPGSSMMAEAVATSVTVGEDGYWYVGELRGIPATPGTSQVWRIKPGTVNAVCDPAAPTTGSCRRYADGFTSIMDLAADEDGGIYVLELSAMSWLQWELEFAGAEVGALHRIDDDGDVEELAAGELTLPGNVDVENGDDDPFVTSPVFGPGAIWEVED